MEGFIRGRKDHETSNEATSTGNMRTKLLRPERMMARHPEQEKRVTWRYTKTTCGKTMIQILRKVYQQCNQKIPPPKIFLSHFRVLEIQI